MKARRAIVHRRDGGKTADINCVLVNELGLAVTPLVEI